MAVKPDVDPRCLCGHEHPCPTHSQWAGVDCRRPAVQLNPLLLLRLLNDTPRAEQQDEGAA